MPYKYAYDSEEKTYVPPKLKTDPEYPDHRDIQHFLLSPVFL